MPISSPKGKEIIQEWFKEQRDIQSIVDIGAGSGTYPKLLGIRKYKWIAIEIWEPYIKRFLLDRIYDEIIIGDITSIDLPEGDCAILGDVLEHLKKREAIATFKRVDKQFRHVVVSIPIGSKSQYVYMGNEHERHISVWSREELEKLIPDTYLMREFVDPICVFIK